MHISGTCPTGIPPLNSKVSLVCCVPTRLVLSLSIGQVHTRIKLPRPDRPEPLGQNVFHLTTHPNHFLYGIKVYSDDTYLTMLAKLYPSSTNYQDQVFTVIGCLFSFLYRKQSFLSYCHRPRMLISKFPTNPSTALNLSTCENVCISLLYISSATNMHKSTVLCGELPGSGFTIGKDDGVAMLISLLRPGTMCGMADLWMLEIRGSGER